MKIQNPNGAGFARTVQSCYWLEKYKHLNHVKVLIRNVYYRLLVEMYMQSDKLDEMYM